MGFGGLPESSFAPGYEAHAVALSVLERKFGGSNMSFHNRSARPPVQPQMAESSRLNPSHKPRPLLYPH